MTATVTTAAAVLRSRSVTYPHISNLDEFTALKRVPGLRLSWARDPPGIAAADILILPGSKHVADDLAWLRRHGLDAAIAAHVAADKPTLALCGGLQMLGRELTRPSRGRGRGERSCIAALRYGVSAEQTLSAGNLSSGCVRRVLGTLGRCRIRRLRNPSWAHAAGGGCDLFPGVSRAVLDDGCGWQSGQVLALYVHGMFENPHILRRLFGHETGTLDDTLDGLADYVDRHFGAGALLALANPRC